MKRRKLLNNLGMLSLFNFGSHLASVLHAQETFLAGTSIANIRLPHLTEDKNAPVVFYSPIVSSEAMLKLLVQALRQSRYQNDVLQRPRQRSKNRSDVDQASN